MRKSLGLDRLPGKVNKQQSTSTLELWVLYQQLKLTAAAKSSGEQPAEGTRHGHNAKAHQPCEPNLSYLQQISKAAEAQSQTANGLPALQHLKTADSVASAVDTSDHITAGLQTQHGEQHTRQARSWPDALCCTALVLCCLVLWSQTRQRLIYTCLHKDAGALQFIRYSTGQHPV